MLRHKSLPERLPRLSERGPLTKEVTSFALNAYLMEAFRGHGSVEIYQDITKAARILAAEEQELSFVLRFALRGMQIKDRPGSGVTSMTDAEYWDFDPLAFDAIVRGMGEHKLAPIVGIQLLASPHPDVGWIQKNTDKFRMVGGRELGELLSIHPEAEAEAVFRPRATMQFLAEKGKNLPQLYTMIFDVRTELLGPAGLIPKEQVAAIWVRAAADRSDAKPALRIKRKLWARLQEESETIIGALGDTKLVPCISEALTRAEKAEAVQLGRLWKQLGQKADSAQKQELFNQWCALEYDNLPSGMLGKGLIPTEANWKAFHKTTLLNLRQGEGYTQTSGKALTLGFMTLDANKSIPVEGLALIADACRNEKDLMKFCLKYVRNGNSLKTKIPMMVGGIDSGHKVPFVDALPGEIGKVLLEMPVNSPIVITEPMETGLNLV